MRLRDREEINASILTTAGSGCGAILTKLMFSSYLTHSQVLQYSKTLIERGFLEYDKIDKVYKTTPYGFRFLELHGEMSLILNVQQELELSRR
ncbi:MAG: winged helix-turn-helix domain-containing protein [Nitrososphaeraceae archaeon]